MLKKYGIKGILCVYSSVFLTSEAQQIQQYIKCIFLAHCCVFLARYQHYYSNSGIAIKPTTGMRVESPACLCTYTRASLHVQTKRCLKTLLHGTTSGQKLHMVPLIHYFFSISGIHYA